MAWAAWGLRNGSSSRHEIDKVSNKDEMRNRWNKEQSWDAIRNKVEIYVDETRDKAKVYADEIENSTTSTNNILTICRQIMTTFPTFPFSHLVVANSIYPYHVLKGFK